MRLVYGEMVEFLGCFVLVWRGRCRRALDHRCALCATQLRRLLVTDLGVIGMRMGKKVEMKIVLDTFFASCFNSQQTRGDRRPECGKGSFS